MSDLMDEERLQTIYKDLGDDQVLSLMRDRENLTQMADRVLAAEASARGLKLPEKSEQAAIAETAVETGGEELELCRLCRFQLAADAETAASILGEAGISSRVDRARGRATEGGPIVEVPGLDLFVVAADEEPAKLLLRRRMKLFPLPEVDAHAQAGEAEPLFIAGSFPTSEAADVLAQALKEAGIVASTAEASDDDGTFWAVEVAFDDLEPALEVAEKVGLPQWPVESKTWA